MYLQMLPGTFVENASFFDEKENFIVGAFLTVTMFNIGCTIKWLAAIVGCKKANNALLDPYATCFIKTSTTMLLYCPIVDFNFLKTFFQKKSRWALQSNGFNMFRQFLNHQLFGFTHLLQLKPKVRNLPYLLLYYKHGFQRA